jgi:hypothetical protein
MELDEDDDEEEEDEDEVGLYSCRFQLTHSA